MPDSLRRARRLAIIENVEYRSAQFPENRLRGGNVPLVMAQADTEAFTVPKLAAYQKAKLPQVFTGNVLFGEDSGEGFPANFHVLAAVIRHGCYSNWKKGKWL
jgi:hypothetical protein